MHRGSGRTVAGVLAALAAVSVACSWGRSDDGGSGAGDGERPATSAPRTDRPGPSAPRTERPGPAATTGPASTGTVTVSFRGTRGSDRVRCAAIDTEFAVTAYQGPIVWTAEPRATEPARWPYDGNPAAGVGVEPASGTLAEGQSAVVRVRGTATGRQFFIAVSAPNAAGHSLVSVPFSCL